MSISINFGKNSLFKCVSQPEIMKTSLKPPTFGFQGRSKSSMLVPLEMLSAVLIMISSKSVSICNRSHTRLVNSSRNCAFWKGYPNLMHSNGGLLELRGSKLTLFDAENFICMLSWSIFSDFDAVHFGNVCHSLKPR